MPSQRRLRTFAILVFCVVFYILFTTSSTRHASTSNPRDFYSRTQAALNKEHARADSSLEKIVPVRQAALNDEDARLAEQMAERLKEAEDSAKHMANAKAPTRDSVMGSNGEDREIDQQRHDHGLGDHKSTKSNKVVEDLGESTVEKAVGTMSAGSRDKSVAGRIKYPVESADEVPGTAGKAQKKVTEEEPTEEEKEAQKVKATLDSILKKAPVIIFSKSYCPHSKRAKNILLNKYSITPAPFVVELDEHPLGPQLQARLHELTGRRTVPNVLVQGKSIGGGDDMAALDESGELPDKLMGMVGKSIQVIKKE